MSMGNRAAVDFLKKITKKSTVVFSLKSSKNSTADKVQMRRTYDITTGRMLTCRLPVSVYTGASIHDSRSIPATVAGVQHKNQNY